MTEEKTPHYITELKKDLTGHFDKKIESEINGLAQIIYKTVALKEDIKNMATKDDIRDMVMKDDIRDMATKQDLKDLAKKVDVDKIYNLVGSYEVRTKNLEDKIFA